MCGEEAKRERGVAWRKGIYTLCLPSSYYFTRLHEIIAFPHRRQFIHWCGRRSVPPTRWRRLITTTKSQNTPMFDGDTQHTLCIWSLTNSRASGVYHWNPNLVCALETGTSPMRKTYSTHRTIIVRGTRDEVERKINQIVKVDAMNTLPIARAKHSPTSLLGNIHIQFNYHMVFWCVQRASSRNN